MITVVLGLLVFGVLVIFHEWGHFVAARSLGITVERFSVGFGPVVYSRVHNGVQFAISALPLGGYVKMAGDDPRNREGMDPGDFFAAAWWKRVIVALAGPAANLVLAIILSIILTWVGVRVADAPTVVGAVTVGSLAETAGFRTGDQVIAVDGVSVASLQPLYLAIVEPKDPESAGDEAAITVERNGSTETLYVPRAQADDIFLAMEFPIPAMVGEVVMGMPAYTAGIAEGDHILAINDEPIANWAEMTRVVREHPGEELKFTLSRADRTVEVLVTPMSGEAGAETIGRIGITAASPVTHVIRFGFMEGITRGTVAAFVTVKMTVQGIGSLFSSPSNLKQMSGPVAIIQASGDAAKAGWDRLLNIGVLLNVALMVFNLLPIPILDGGMVLLSLVEAVRRRPMGNRGIAIYQGIGLAVIGTIFLFVLIHDPLRLIQRQSALGRATDVVP